MNLEWIEQTVAASQVVGHGISQERCGAYHLRLGISRALVGFKCAQNITSVHIYTLTGWAVKAASALFVYQDTFDLWVHLAPLQAFPSDS